MATLNQLLGVKIGHEDAILKGAPVLSAIPDSEGNLYYIGTLLKPMEARCSVDPDLEAVEVDEVYIREGDVNSDKWAFVDEQDPSKGVYLPGYILDFSISHGVVLLQSESIRSWLKGNRSVKQEKKKDSTRQLIREMNARRGR